MHSVSTRNDFQAVLPILGTSAAFASLIGIVLAFGTVAMTMM